MTQKYAWVAAFELAVLRQLVADPIVLPKVGQYLDPARFPSEAGTRAAEVIVGYWKRIGRAPTATAALQEARRRQEDGKWDAEAVRSVAQVLDEAMEATPADSAYVIEQVCADARKEAVWKALDAGLLLHAQGRIDDIEKGIAAATRIGRVDMDPGLDWAASLDERTEHRVTRKEPPRWGTGVPELDDDLRGGLTAGELGVFVAPPGGGKSMALVGVTAHVMNLGGTVAYYSFEMSEPDIVDRIDSAVTGVPMQQLRQQAEDVKRRVDGWLRRCKGGCVVKKFAARVTSAKDVRAHLQYLRAERSVCPTVLVFDYADKMASSDGQRYEKDHQIVGAVYDEVRNLGAEFGCPAWTASQTNAEGDEAKVATGHHIARAREKWANADVMVSINRTEEEKQMEQVRLHIIKARYTVDGITIGPLRSDYGRGLIVARRGA